MMHRSLSKYALHPLSQSWPIEYKKPNINEEKICALWACFETSGRWTSAAASDLDIPQLGDVTVMPLAAFSLFLTLLSLSK